MSTGEMYRVSVTAFPERIMCGTVTRRKDLSECEQQVSVGW